MTSSVQNNAENLTAGWIAEWVGPVGRSACFAGVQANTFLSSDPSRLVVQYLRKYEMVDLFDFQKAYGKEKVLEFLGDETEQLGVPYQVEKLLQTDLTMIFKDPEILQSFAGKKKLTEVSSLFFKMQGLTLNIAVGLGISNVQYDEFSDVFLQPHGDIREKGNQWIIKLDEPIAPNQSIETQNALVPAGAEIPSFVDQNYSIFVSTLPSANLPVSCTTTRSIERVDNEDARYCLTTEYRPPCEEGEKGEIAVGYAEHEFALGIQWKVPAENPLKMA